MEDPVQIVCGAPNVDKGQKVLVATVGTTLVPEAGKGFEIKKAKIRGEESLGMICAEDELGIGKSHEGIMVLPVATKVGLPAADYLGIETDHILEIGLTPNRSDAFGHFGVARDLAARLSLTNKRRAELPSVEALEIPVSGSSQITVKILDRTGCGRYAGLHIENIKIAPSPAWLQNRLRAIGLTPKNNVVDITNFVLHETGQPLHAFDADKIAGGEVIIQTLPEGSTFETLDGTSRSLSSEDLMICDAKGGMCLAGVLGGAESGVSEHTKSIFLESAWFAPGRIRKSAKRHALNTDASFRFERGVDPGGTLYALRRAASLILEMAGGSISSPLIDEVTEELPKAVELEFSAHRFNQLSGSDVDKGLIKKVLEALDFDILNESDGIFSLRVPTYRVDVTREIDVVEEVLRIIGYNTATLPDQMNISVSIPRFPQKSQVIDMVSNVLVGRGFSEMLSNGLTRSDFISDVAGNVLDEVLVAMLNPLSMELDVLRPGMAVSVLESVARNLNRQAERLMVFELGKTYQRAGTGYKEDQRLALALVGSRQRENWNNTAGDFDHSDLMGHLQSVLDTLGLSIAIGKALTDPFFGIAHEVLADQKPVGMIGSVSAKALKRYGIKKQVLIADIDFEACFRKVKHGAATYKELPKYPAVRRDLSLLVDQGVSFAAIERAVLANGGKLVREVGLFDVYEGENLPKGKKSYAIRIALQDENKTLNDKQIEKTMSKIQSDLESSLGASLR